VTLTHPSPNFGERRGGQRPDLVVIHYTAMASCAEALERLCDPVAEVSAHYLIDTDGTLLSLVEEASRAWHAGAGEWAGRGDVNSRSIGIELANTGSQPFPAPQMRALETLLAGILDRWSLPLQAVIGHSDMAPDRKGDPGPRFDWRGLAWQGLSIWPDPCAARRFCRRPARLRLSRMPHPTSCCPPSACAFAPGRPAPWTTPTAPLPPTWPALPLTPRPHAPNPAPVRRAG
jgi:N-acetylmuramoyl-L-alanine amidase